MSENMEPCFGVDTFIIYLIVSTITTLKHLAETSTVLNVCMKMAELYSQIELEGFHLRHNPFYSKGVDPDKKVRGDGLVC